MQNAVLALYEQVQTALAHVHFGWDGSASGWVQAFIALLNRLAQKSRYFWLSV